MKKLYLLIALALLLFGVVSSAGVLDVPSAEAQMTLIVAGGGTPDGGGGPEPTGITDPFTDDNDTTIANHTTVTTWTAAVDDNSDMITIQSNAVQAAGWAGQSTFRCTSTEDSSQITVKSTTPSPYMAGPCVRVQSAASGYCAFFSAASGGNWTNMVMFKADGYFDAIGAGTWSQSSDHTIKVTASGTNPVSLHVYVDDVEVGTGLTDDSSPLGTGNSGFECNNGSSGTPYTIIDDYTDQ